MLYLLLICYILMFHQRKIYKDLLQWKNSRRRKPLIIRGARQVGKSTLVREFSKEYDSFIELNLERKEDLLFFELDNIKDIVEATLLRDNYSLKNGSILFFIDEIQESSKAIQFLRFFYEDYPELHVICAGSLLEFALKDISSFPVGRIQQLILHPFDFEEFLMAKGNEQAINILKKIQ